MHGSEAYTLPGVVESSECVVSQREVTVSSFHVRARVLEDVGELRRLHLQPVRPQPARCAATVLARSVTSPPSSVGL